MRATQIGQACAVQRRAIFILAVAVFLVATAESSAASTQSSFRVGLVADATVLSDRTAGHSIYVGLRRAVSELGVSGRVLTPSVKEGFTPSLDYLARQGYDVVVVAGFVPGAVVTAAREFPKTTFVVPDQTIPGSPPNVRFMIFREEQIGYLAGYLAGLMEKQRSGKDVVGSVGGGKYGTVDRYIAGFRAGARAADPGIGLLNGYSKDFVDPRRCHGVASDEIARGAGVVIAVAGNCGFGALEAARLAHIWGIGVDTDVSYLGPYILTSAVKREDVALYDTIRDLKDGSLHGGGVSLFTLRNGGLQLGRISAGVPATLIRAVERVRRRVAAGTIHIPSTFN
jgi:basic membrane protein A